MNKTIVVRKAIETEFCTEKDIENLTQQINTEFKKNKIVDLSFQGIKKIDFNFAESLLKNLKENYNDIFLVLHLNIVHATSQIDTTFNFCFNN